MKKNILIVVTTVTLTLGAVTAAYAMGFNNSNNSGFAGNMMNQSRTSYSANNSMMNESKTNNNYNNMIDLMRENGFGAGAEAMENGDINAMNQFMNNLTDDQYNQMINIMKDNGYGNMAKVMSSVSRQQMISIHNSMMGR